MLYLSVLIKAMTKTALHKYQKKTCWVTLREEGKNWVYGGSWKDVWTEILEDENRLCTAFVMA